MLHGLIFAQSDGESISSYGYWFTRVSRKSSLTTPALGCVDYPNIRFLNLHSPPVIRTHQQCFEELAIDRINQRRFLNLLVRKTRDKGYFLRLCIFLADAAGAHFEWRYSRGQCCCFSSKHRQDEKGAKLMTTSASLDEMIAVKHSAAC